MIFDLLVNLKQQQFTGIVRVRAKTASSPTEWKIYFCLGKLIWTESGCHPHRLWYRHVLKYFSQLDSNQTDISTYDEMECREYYLLTTLLQRKLVEQKLIIQLIISKTTEIFFDILQQEEIQSLYLEPEKLSASSLLEYGLKMSVAMLEVEQVCFKAQQLWSLWKQNDLSFYSPNAAPRIKNQERLQQEVPAVVYQNFVRWLDGKRTLRDLAVGMNKSVLKLTVSLMPYINKGLLEFVDVPDVEVSLTTANPCTDSLKSSQAAAANKPLIVCIDDSPQVCQIMEQIITRADYHFLSIQQPLQAIPTLITTNPLLIFLDIGMPLMNGYELCSQIRRVSKLKDIPIVFLTGNDGIVDRVKAKVVGASDFVAKPIEVDKIVKTIEKFSRSQAAAVSTS